MSAAERGGSTLAITFVFVFVFTFVFAFTLASADLPAQSPARFDAAEPREVAWAAANVKLADARLHDDLRRTLARFRRPRGDDDERALQLVLDALVRTEAVVPPKELDFPASPRTDGARLALLLRNPSKESSALLLREFLAREKARAGTLGSDGEGWEAIGDELLARRDREFVGHLVRTTRPVALLRRDRAPAGNGGAPLRWGLLTPDGWPSLPQHCFLRDRPGTSLKIVVIRTYDPKAAPGGGPIRIQLPEVSIEPPPIARQRARARWLAELAGGAVEPWSVEPLDLRAVSPGTAAQTVFGALVRAQRSADALERALHANGTLPRDQRLPAPAIVWVPSDPLQPVRAPDPEPFIPSLRPRR